MTADELKEARRIMGLTQKKMAEELETPFRTYQDWEGGLARIPGSCAVAVRCLLKKNKGHGDRKR
jgi:DNA-binding transcriptional regulator YiaG